MSFSPPLVDLTVHHAPGAASDRFAWAVTKLLRWCADVLFAKHYGHRAIVLETEAAVPGMVDFTQGTAARSAGQSAQDRRGRVGRDPGERKPTAVDPHGLRDR